MGTPSADGIQSVYFWMLVLWSTFLNLLRRWIVTLLFSLSTKSENYLRFWCDMLHGRSEWLKNFDAQLFLLGQFSALQGWPFPSIELQPLRRLPCSSVQLKSVHNAPKMYPLSRSRAWSTSIIVLFYARKRSSLYHIALSARKGRALHHDWFVPPLYFANLHMYLSCVL